MTEGFPNPLQPGDKAPAFVLSAVDREGAVRLTDYSGRGGVLVALFNGLYCPFCRRGIAQFGATREKLLVAGVESLAVVATELDNARLYFKYRPSRVPIVVDPEFATHRAFGLPLPPMDEAAMQAVYATKVNPFGDLPEPAPISAASAALDKIDGFERTAADQRDIQRQYTGIGQLRKGQFLVDSTGTIRWANIECSREGLAGVGKFPSDNELLDAARALA
jgi:peroxiredoxin